MAAKICGYRVVLDASGDRNFATLVVQEAPDGASFFAQSERPF